MPPPRAPTRAPTTPRSTNPPTCTSGWRPTAPPWPWSDDDDPPFVLRAFAPCTGADRPAGLFAAETRARCGGLARTARAAGLGTTLHRRPRGAHRAAARSLEFRRRRQAPAHARPRTRVAHDDAGTTPRRARWHAPLGQPLAGTARTREGAVRTDAHDGSGSTPRPARQVAFDVDRRAQGLARRASRAAEREAAIKRALSPPRAPATRCARATRRSSRTSTRRPSPAKRRS